MQAFSETEITLHSLISENCQVLYKPTSYLMVIIRLALHTVLNQTENNGTAVSNGIHTQPPYTLKSAQ